jgi:hypothetical protein
VPFGDYQKTEGKQRTVWVPFGGGQIVSGGTLLPVSAVIVESGVAVIDAGMLADNILVRTDVTVPIIKLPAGGIRVKAVAASWPSSFGSRDDADSFGWAVDSVEVKVDAGTNTVQLVIHDAQLGMGTNVMRYGYHITFWLLHMSQDQRTLASLEFA